MRRTAVAVREVEPGPEVKESPIRISAKEKALILKAVADKYDGELTPDLVVKEANPKNTKGVARRLADLIGWSDDDATAAKKWRIECARTVIRAVEPELIDLGVIQIKAPYYVHDPNKPPGKQGYVPLLAMKTEQQAAEELMQTEINAAVAALERAYNIATALGLEAETAELLGALSVLGRSPAVAQQEVPEVRAARRARA